MDSMRNTSRVRIRWESIGWCMSAGFQFGRTIKDTAFGQIAGRRKAGPRGLDIRGANLYFFFNKL